MSNIDELKGLQTLRMKLSQQMENKTIGGGIPYSERAHARLLLETCERLKSLLMQSSGEDQDAFLDWMEEEVRK